jgi:chitosanase
MLFITDTIPAVVVKLNALFENDTIASSYNYLEYLGDGRGFTFGRVGFTTATGDGYDLIKSYTDANPKSALLPYVEALKKLAKKNSDDTLSITGFANAWRAEAMLTKAFQDKVAYELYELPAINYCKLLGLKTTLALAIVFDAIVQHGDGKDDDGIRKLFKHTIKNLNGTPSGRNHKNQSCNVLTNGEEKFLAMFLCERKEILEDANDKESREEWEESAERVMVLKQLLDEGNFELLMPFAIKSEDWNAVIQ